MTKDEWVWLWLFGGAQRGTFFFFSQGGGKTFQPKSLSRKLATFWGLGGGLMVDWGVHLLDMAIWVEDNRQSLPGVLTYAANVNKRNRDRDTFDTMNVLYPKKDFLINYDMNGGLQNRQYGKPYGNWICRKRTLGMSIRWWVRNLSRNGIQNSKASKNRSQETGRNDWKP